VKLLFDENLPEGLSKHLREQYPGSVHVAEVGLLSAKDITIWDYAKEHGLTIVTKDSDFHRMVMFATGSPKVVWIATGNCSVAALLSLLQSSQQLIAAFLEDPQTLFFRLK
jgi:predicted nuclease of predicted toxin-antitoxin system